MHAPSLIPLIILAALHLFNPCLASYYTWNHPDPDEHLSVIELITSKGYPAEQHHVHTLDGYILTVHRIRSGRFKEKDTLMNRPVVFLQHGLLDSSATWVVNGVGESLGFLLADSGYDVWMGNVRGNTFGMGHVKLSPEMKEFWDFSWDEMSEFDLPSMINYSLHHTNHSQLIYIGHSQGTMIMFSHLNRNPEFASKITLFLALGPVATVASMQSPIKYLASFADSLIYDMFGRKDFLPSSKYIRWLADIVCNNHVTTPLICDNVLFLLAGPSQNLNNSRIAVYTNHAPAGTSVKNLIHYSQSVKSKRFQMFDYGPALNAHKYNQTTPPLYNLTNIHVDIGLYWANNDWLADPDDVNYVRKALPMIVDDYEVQGWNHLDFVWGINARTILYDRMLKLMKTY